MRQKRNHRRPLIAIFACLCLVEVDAAWAQPVAGEDAGFSWVNPGCRSEPLSAEELAFVGLEEAPEVEYPATLRHATFVSPSMQRSVGYCIYLPPGYDASANAQKRYPVVYHLHGGRPGNESRSAALAADVDAAMRSGSVGEAIYVFPNGGLVSHYDSAQHDSFGEKVFVAELVAHIDSRYRTRAERSGRALQGFSQGGRATARILFKHPELFCSAAAGGGGYATEKEIFDSGGVEDTQTARRNYGGPLEFAPLDNTWALAAKAVERGVSLPKILFWFGTDDFNYQANLDYMAYLESLGVEFERLVIPDAPHHPVVIYQSHGVDIMTFHERSCGWPAAPASPEVFVAGSTVAETLQQHRALREIGDAIWWRPVGDDMRWNNKNLHQIAPSVNLYRGGQVKPLRRTPNPALAAYEVDLGDSTMSFDQLVSGDRSTTMGVVVLHRGEVVYERYPRMQPHEKPIWWSVTKVFASTLVGMLEDRGLVDVSQPVDRYVPALRGSDFEGVSVRDVLDMASGVDCGDGDYNDLTTCYMRFEASLGDGERDASSPDNPYDMLATLAVGKWAPPGTGFDYSGANTFVLSWLVEEVLDMPFQDAVSREIWTRIGAESDASIYAGRNGIALSSGGLMARLRDVARFGLLFTPSHGVVTERKLLSSKFLETLTRGGRPQLLENARYGSQLESGVKFNVYQWDRVFDNNDLYKGGWAGQGLLVNPQRDLVAVWVGYAPAEGQSSVDLLPHLRAALEATYPPP